MHISYRMQTDMILIQTHNITYERRHMSAYVPICAYISMYPLLLAIHMCLYVWYMHVTNMHIQAYMR